MYTQKSEIHVYVGIQPFLLLIYRFFQVACALLMAGKNLDDHIDVKNILIEMGIYFQVQVIIAFT